MRVVGDDKIATSWCVVSPDLVKSWEIEDTQLRVVGDVQRFNSAQIWSKKVLERIVRQNEVPKSREVSARRSKFAMLLSDTL
jgi:hypothetical protein